MPGGRLAGEDRRRIADGLADGLGYAEIARLLGRPTSTVSREVARNGGPAGYRAEHAQEATARRARRPRSIPPAPGESGLEPEAVREYLDRFAELMVRTGMPRMAARVLVALITTDSGALTAAELVANLRVSPASVSKAVAYLEEYALIRRERDARRRERYVIDDDVWLRAWSTDAERHATVAATVHDGTVIFGADTPTGRRLGQMGRFFAQLSEDMSAGLDPLMVEDAWTVLTALVHAGTPRTAAELAAALAWPVERATKALSDSEEHPELGGPVALARAGNAYTLIPRPGQLTAAQIDALRR